MALIGNGAQSEFQAMAFKHLVGIEEIRLFDTGGRLVFSKKMGAGKTGLRVEIPGLPTGIFWVNLRGAAGSFNQKLVVTH